MSRTRDYKIRQAKPSDMDEVLEMLYGLKQMYGSVPAMNLDSFQRMYRLSLEGFLDTNNCLLLVAEGEKGRLSGFASFTWKWVLRHPKPLGSFEELFVRPEERHKGIATELWTAAATQLKKYGVERVEVTTSLAHPGQREYARSVGMEWYSSVHSVSI